MINKVIRFFILFNIIFILNSASLHAKIFKFNNLEEARKIYSTNPSKAHALVDETINHYLKKQNKNYPWLGWAYSDKAMFLDRENNKKLALEYQTKACKEQEKDFKK